MARVIQDSDDEFDEEDLEEIQDDAPTAIAHDGSSTGQDPITRGTGSTESLKNAIQAAHHAQFETQIDPSNQDVTAQHEYDTEASAARAPGTTSQKQSSLTSSGKPKSLTSSPFITELRNQNQNPNIQLMGQGYQLVQQQRDHLLPAPDNVWALDGTIRANYADHEPMAIFPEPSSTVMNTTFTQERLMQEVMDPAFLGIMIEPEPEPIVSPYKPQSTIPWSDFLKTQSDHTPAATSQEAAQQASSRHEHGLQFAELGGTTLDRPEMERLSQCSRPGSPDILEDSSAKAPINAEIPLHQTANVSGSLEGPPTDQHTTPHSSRRESAAVNMTSSSGKKPAEKELSSQPPKKKRKSSQVVASDDYLEDIGLPKEQYKPRPSRSRSLKTPLEQPADYSVQPEKVARKRARRSKTTSEIDGGTATSTPQKVQQICDMGFTPSSTQRALKKNVGDVNKTIEWLVNNGSKDDEDELAPPRTTQRKNKVTQSTTKPASSTHNVETPSKGTVPTQAENTNEVCSPPAETHPEPVLAPTAPTKDTPDTNVVPEPQTPAKVAVVIPWSKGLTSVPEKESIGPIETQPTQEAPSRKAERKKTEAEPQELNAAPTAKKDQKRGRGRPKKDQTVALAADHEIIAVENAEKEDAHLDKSPIQNTDDLVKDMPPPSTKKPASTPPPQKTKLAQGEATQTPETQMKPSNGNTLPPSSGKTLYRVGLSKRARIAPLLKIVKK